MKVLVLSDSHGSFGRVMDIYYKEQPRAIIFLGDGMRDAQQLYTFSGGCAVYTVKGNCDFATNAEETRILELEGHRLLITHGHKFGVKSSLLPLSLKAEETGVELALFGHTHRQYYDGRLANPGSAAVGYYGVLEIDGKNLNFRFGDLDDKD